MHTVCSSLSAVGEPHSLLAIGPARLSVVRCPADRRILDILAGLIPHRRAHSYPNSQHAQRVHDLVAVVGYGTRCGSIVIMVVVMLVSLSIVTILAQAP